MFASYLYQPQPRRVLIVGLGGGAMVRFLTHFEPQAQIDAVEIDPAVVRLASPYLDVRSGGNVRVHTADAVAFVESVTDRYDLILMDAFLRPSSDTDTTGVPTRLKTLEFLGRLKQTLTPGGVVAFNVNEHATMADDIAAVTTVFRPGCGLSQSTFGQQGGDRLRGRLADRRPSALPVLGALDARFGEALSLAELMRNRE